MKIHEKITENKPLSYKEAYLAAMYTKVFHSDTQDTDIQYNYMKVMESIVKNPEDDITLIQASVQYYKKLPISFMQYMDGFEKYVDFHRVRNMLWNSETLSSVLDSAAEKIKIRLFDSNRGLSEWIQNTPDLDKTMEDIRYVFLMNITDNNTTDNNKVSSAEIKPSLMNRAVLWYYKVKLIHMHSSNRFLLSTAWKMHKIKKDASVAKTKSVENSKSNRMLFAEKYNDRVISNKSEMISILKTLRKELEDI